MDLCRLPIITTLILFIAETLAAAQPAQDEGIEVELEEVIATASRTPVPINQTAKTVTVITKEQIARSPVQSVQDLLVYAANLDVIQRGGHGVQADISIRGGTFDQNAILLNGVNFSNAHTGHYNFDLPLNLSDIERIEIIHGPSALIYGASAFSGGINIVTKKGADDSLYARAEAGMHKMRGMEIRGAGSTGKTINSLSVGYNSSAGYIDNSGYDIYNVLWQTRFLLGDESMLDLQMGYNDKEYGANTFYSPRFPNQYERTSTYMGSLKGEFGDVLKVIPIVYWNRHHDQFDLIKDTDQGRNFHRNDTYGMNLIFLYKSRLGSTSLGGELRKDDIMSSVLGYPMVRAHRRYLMYDDRVSSSVTLEHSVVIDRFVASAGVLMNHNTLLKGRYKFFPSVSATYKPADGFSVSSTWAKSTRLPTFTDLFYTTETHSGNEGLKPEQSESLDLSFRYKGHGVSAYATGFLQWGRNMIDWVKENPGDEKWSSWNLSELDIRGVEAGVMFYLGNICPSLGEQALLALDYTRTHLTHDAGDLLSIYSLNHLRDKFTARFSHKIYKELSASWNFRFQKRMGQYEKYVNQEKVGIAGYPAFSTLDLKLNYRIGSMNIYLNLNNLYDTRYFDIGNIPQPGFWLSGGITYSL